MTGIELGDLRYDREQESLVRHFASDSPTNSGLVEVRIDPHSTMIWTLTINCMEPVRVFLIDSPKGLGSMTVQEGVMFSPSRAALIEKIRNSKRLVPLIDGFLNDTLNWLPYDQRTEKEDILSDDGFLVEEIKPEKK